MLSRGLGPVPMDTGYFQLLLTTLSRRRDGSGAETLGLERKQLRYLRVQLGAGLGACPGRNLGFQVLPMRESAPGGCDQGWSLPSLPNPGRNPSFLCLHFPKTLAWSRVWLPERFGTGDFSSRRLFAKPRLGAVGFAGMLQRWHGAGEGKLGICAAAELCIHFSTARSLVYSDFSRFSPRICPTKLLKVNLNGGRCWECDLLSCRNWFGWVGTAG